MGFVLDLLLASPLGGFGYQKTRTATKSKKNRGSLADPLFFHD